MGSGRYGILDRDGLVAARGQRFREGPCASHPARTRSSLRKAFRSPQKVVLEMENEPFTKSDLVLNIFVGIVAVLAVYAGVNVFQLQNETWKLEKRLPDPYAKRATELEKRLDTMQASLNEAMREVANNEALVETLSNAQPTTVQVASLTRELKSMESELKQLNDAVGQSPEKSLAVPMLKRDIDNLRESSQRDLDATQLEIGRVHDIMKWFLGTVITMPLSLIALVANNFLHMRKA